LRNLKDSATAAQRLSATSLHTSSCRVVASPLSAQARGLAQTIGSKVRESAAESLLIGVDVGEGSIACQQLDRSEEHTSELQSRFDLVCRLLLEKKTHD